MRQASKIRKPTTLNMARRLSLFAACLLLMFANHASAEQVQLQAVFVIDGKTTFSPGDTVIINGTEFDDIEIGDQFIVDFTLDSEGVDSNDLINTTDNRFLVSDARIGNFGSVLSALSMAPQAGNAGSFDPSGKGYSASTASSTSDAVVVYKSNNAIANSEAIRLLVATNPVPANLGGELSDVILNFHNLQPLGGPNPEDYLEDRSVTIDPFNFGDLFSGTSQVNGNIRDLVFLDDDILGSGFAVDNLNRPLSLRFGEADVLPANGPSFQQSLYVWGTFVSLSLPPVPPLIPPLTPGQPPIATPTPTPIPTPLPVAARTAAVPLPETLTFLLILALAGFGARHILNPRES